MKKKVRRPQSAKPKNLIKKFKPNKSIESIQMFHPGINDTEIDLAEESASYPSQAPESNRMPENSNRL